MLTRMVSISCPRDPPTSASQSTGITGMSRSARPWIFFIAYIDISNEKKIGSLPAIAESIFKNFVLRELEVGWLIQMASH